MILFVILTAFLPLTAHLVDGSICGSDLVGVERLKLSTDLKWGAFSPVEEMGGVVDRHSPYRNIEIRECNSGNSLFSGEGRSLGWAGTELWFVGRGEKIFRFDPRSGDLTGWSSRVPKGGIVSGFFVTGEGETFFTVSRLAKVLKVCRVQDGKRRATWSKPSRENRWRKGSASLLYAALGDSFVTIFQMPQEPRASLILFSGDGATENRLLVEHPDEQLLSLVAAPDHQSVFFASYRDNAPRIFLGRVTRDADVTYWPASDGCDIEEWDEFPRVIAVFVEDGVLHAVIRIATRQQLMEYRVDLETEEISCVALGTEEEGLVFLQLPVSHQDMNDQAENQKGSIVGGFRCDMAKTSAESIPEVKLLKQALK